MLAVIAWKEWRQQYAIVIAILALAGVLVATALFTAPMPRVYDRSWIGNVVQPAMLLLAITQGIVTGAMLFAGETEDRTQDFLDQHAGLRSPIWRAKMLSGLAIVGVSGLIYFGLAYAVTTGHPDGRAFGDPPVYLAVLVAFALEALVWASACSIDRRTTFGANGFSLAAYLLVGVGGFVFLANVLPVPLAMVLRLLMPIVLARISWRLYCADDLRRDRVAVFPRIRLTWLTLPAWLTIPLVILWKRHKPVLLILALGPIALIYASLYWPVLACWPIGTFLLGCVAGWAVFADEQAEGAERFLGDQRFPAGRLWLGKTLPLFLLALLGSAIPLLFINMFGDPMQIRRFEEILPYRPNTDSRTQDSAFIAMYILTFAVQGFAFALFATQQTRKLPVAIFLTLALGGLTAAVWYPSLFAGLGVWRVWLIPAVIAFATLRLLPRWTTGRLHDARGIATLIGLLALGALWIAGNLWWRVAQIPDPGEPFDARAYRAALAETPDTHGSELREASAQLTERLKKAAVRFPIHDEDGKFLHADWWEDDVTALDWAKFRDKALHGSLPKNRGPYEQYLTFVFDGDWCAAYTKAALAAPDRLQSMGELHSHAFWNEHPISLPILRAKDCFLVRALVRMRDGKTEDALSDLDVALATIRHGLHRTWGEPAYSFTISHTMVLIASERLLLDPAADAAFRVRLADVLARHDDLLPSFAGIVKSTYLLTDQGVDESERASVLQNPLVGAPWERERIGRLARTEFAQLLRQAEDNRFESWKKRYKRLDTLYNWPPQKSDNAPGGDAQFYGFVARYNLDDVLRLETQQMTYVQGLSQLRRLRLSLAAAIYEDKNGRPIASLDDLVPGQFVCLPQSPYIGGSYQYRVSPGDEPINWTDDSRRTTPGQGVVCDAESPSSFVAVLPSKK